MIFLDLFLTFLKIGAVSFGGGYGMIPLIREEVLTHGWMTEDQFLDFIAVAESTPGPIAVNMATFIGSSQGGILGSAISTLGVILPAFCIILVIILLLRNLMKYKGVGAFLGGVRPVVAGLIVATALTMILSRVFLLSALPADSFGFEWKAFVIFVLLVLAAFLWKKLRKKKISPILLILFSAGLGIVFYGVI